MFAETDMLLGGEDKIYQIVDPNPTFSLSEMTNIEKKLEKGLQLS